MPKKVVSKGVVVFRSTVVSTADVKLGVVSGEAVAPAVIIMNVEDSI